MTLPVIININFFADTSDKQLSKTKIAVKAYVYEEIQTVKTNSGFIDPYSRSALGEAEVH